MNGWTRTLKPETGNGRTRVTARSDLILDKLGDERRPNGASRTSGYRPGLPSVLPTRRFPVSIHTWPCGITKASAALARWFRGLTGCGWPRSREIGEKGTLLATMHGTFWSFPEHFSKANTAGIRPRSNYLKVIGDFCRWNRPSIKMGSERAGQPYLEILGFRGRSYRHVTPIIRDRDCDGGCAEGPSDPIRTPTSIRLRLSRPWARGAAFCPWKK